MSDIYTLIAFAVAIAVLAGRADGDLAPGTELTLYGHHHEVRGVAPALCDADAVPADAAPFYLLAGSTTAT
ncbi:hypothetical protein JGS22_005935 [Streptomyces sp. P38-E01]|uniref:Uncharacterized protein n=1 Tax=Streptomyces tardus TaxID=2780544 RepID=A0A949N3T1_9ACTN|nr:hypothetical protein [Streptomyces tardus]MBU7597184.1 hypothetical protein [Streptomyces tardus]